MSKVHTDESGAESESAPEASASSQEHAVYTYESAGISEREGNVPRWLWGVLALLLVWGAYYLVAYWDAPVGPT